MNNYKWKSTAGIKADPIKVHLELQQIENRTPLNIYECAKNKKTELYKCFEWDKKKIAYNYGLIRARYIVNHLEVIIQEEDIINNKEEIIIRAYESLTVPNEGKMYVDTIIALTDYDLRMKIFDEINILLDQAKAKLSDYNKAINIIFENIKEKALV